MYCNVRQSQYIGELKMQSLNVDDTILHIIVFHAEELHCTFVIRCISKEHDSYCAKIGIRLPKIDKFEQ